MQFLHEGRLFYELELPDTLVEICENEHSPLGLPDPVAATKSQMDKV